MTKAINRPEVSNPNCVLGNGCKPATGTNAPMGLSPRRVFCSPCSCLQYIIFKNQLMALTRLCVVIG